MRNIMVIGDTHFGRYNNSITWLRHQESGFHEVIDAIHKSVTVYDETIVVHMGDLFDSRSSINPLIYRAVKSMLHEIDQALGDTGHMYIIGGNHDYYYQWESENNYSSLWMLPNCKNISYVVTGYAVIHNLVMIPWYSFHNAKTLREILSDTSYLQDRIIFTHTDPDHQEPEIYSLIKDIPLVTGHIHTPSYREQLLVTGALFPLTFADSNAERGYWVLHPDSDTLGASFHPIQSSIHFHRLSRHDLDMIKEGCMEESDFGKDDYMEIYIKLSDIQEYEDIIKDLSSKYTVNITYIQEHTASTERYEDILDIDRVCKKMLPEHLRWCYDQMISDRKE